MKLIGEQILDCSVHRAWELLNDVETLQACIPGCESLEVTGQSSYSAVVTVKLGPIKAKFNGDVELTNLSPPNACKIVGKGNGGVAGFAEGGADVQLEALADGSTLLTYHAEAKVGGKIAQLGGRLIDSTAQKLAKQFFTNMQERIKEA